MSGTIIYQHALTNQHFSSSQWSSGILLSDMDWLNHYLLVYQHTRASICCLGCARGCFQDFNSVFIADHVQECFVPGYKSTKIMGEIFFFIFIFYSCNWSQIVSHVKCEIVIGAIVWKPVDSEARKQFTTKPGIRTQNEASFLQYERDILCEMKEQ